MREDHKKKITLKFKEQVLKQRQRKTFQTKEQHLKMTISMQWLQVQSVRVVKKKKKTQGPNLQK